MTSVTLNETIDQSATTPALQKPNVSITGQCHDRVMKAFAHQKPDRTPLFEIFQPFHPISWPICGRTIATDASLYHDALAEGASEKELAEASGVAQFKVNKFFGVDMVRLNHIPWISKERLKKIAKTSWLLDGKKYSVNERTKMVEIDSPGESQSYGGWPSEEEFIRKTNEWDGTCKYSGWQEGAEVLKIRQLAAAEGLDWVFMAELGGGTGAAFFPPYLLMLMLTDPDLFARWQEMNLGPALRRTKDIIAGGYEVVAMGGDVSSDSGPFISPQSYHDQILPAIKRHVQTIHDAGGLAVYTSDGNHWPIKEDFFINSGIDGYKEVDNAAGMTMDRLLAEGIDRRVCIIGNIDARHILCHGTKEEVRSAVFECLRKGETSPGGHILHASHSVHEDVKSINYITMVNSYREYFGMEPLPEIETI